MALLPFDDRDGFIWFNGKLVPWREAQIHVLSHGLHYASVVFEGQRAYNGEIFKLNEHTSRLFNSARILDFEIPYAEDEINAACDEVMKANNLPDGYCRPVAWRGPEQMGVAAQATKTHVAIAGWNGRLFRPAAARQGHPARRPPNGTAPARTGAPTSAKAAGLYMICTLSKHAAERRATTTP